MAHKKLEILLPLYHNPDQNGNRKKIDDDEFTITYIELTKQFGGITIEPTPLSGLWTNPETGKTMSDDLTKYWVIYEDTEKNNEFIKIYKETLKERFKQDDVMLYSMSITYF